MDWAARFQKLYNDHPHSSLGYVRPNEEHAGLGNAIRQTGKENLLLARQRRLEFYKSQKAGVSEYGNDEDRGSNGLIGQDSVAVISGNSQMSKIEVLGNGDSQTNSLALLCQNR